MLAQKNQRAHRSFTAFFAQQCRLRHQPAHRTINVQLLSDLQGLGKLGSIQSVAPGLMRSILYPQGKAVYLLKGVAPRLPPLMHMDPENGVSSSSKDEVDNFADMKRRLEALAPLIFHRRLRTTHRHSPAPSSAKGLPIYGSVTLHDIARRLSENHNLSLVPPDALLSLREAGMKDKLKFIGMFTVLVHLRTGDVISLKVLLEPVVDSKDQDKRQSQGSILPDSNPQIVEARAPHMAHVVQ